MIRENPHDWNLFFVNPLYLPNSTPGLPYNITLPNYFDCELLALSFDFVTDANVSNRYVTLSHFRILEFWPLWSSPSVQTASQTRSYISFIGAPERSAFISNTLIFPLPHRLRFHVASQPRLDSVNMQAGDYFENVKVLWNQWFAPPLY